MADKNGSKGPESLLKKVKRYWGKFWYFFWEEDSFLSWVINILVAFILIKGVIYPGLGMMLNTSHPVVAVISNSMEHEGDFNEWWGPQAEWYTMEGISKEEFLTYDFKNGFNKGDIMVLKGITSGAAGRGDVIVYNSNIRPEPIIHRVTYIESQDGFYFYRTKGDHNSISFPFEYKIPQKDVVGKAVLRVPYLGWIKISFVCLINSVTGKDSFIHCMRGA
ncbi:signal peptidase I [Candidatus Woesearchaeota archaeon CG10_big_fil_rev_8_21_14_0_10_44_13]|nr:MAG: signal peptidase I [Candidatus Woesearchaeota archaeon CG10_big_fil_rev_8_21_14_0_10_44_13]